MIDLSFQLHGDKLDADHGYYLYSALSEHLPFLHDKGTRGRTAIHRIYGRPYGERMIALNSRSTLTLRIPRDAVPDYLPLCGKTLTVGRHSITASFPSSRELPPLPDLRAEIVTIKGFTEPHAFLDAVVRQLAVLRIQGTPHLIVRSLNRSVEGKTNNIERSLFIRRTISIQGRNIVGFPVLVSGLTAEESLRLQERGIGGRRVMGCGIFVSTRE